MEQARKKSAISGLYLKGRWLLCVLPSAAVVAFEETPGLSGLDGINAAALIVLSPFFVAIGFGLTAAIVAFARWTFRKMQMRSRIGFAIFVLVMVGLLSPLAYLDRDWLLLAVIEVASLPAALVLRPATVDVGGHQS